MSNIPRKAQLELLLSISEGLCRGTDEMLKVSPKGDAMHPPSCGLAIRDAVEEIKWLRAEVERQARHIEELREKIDAEKSCCCSYDAPGDVCAAHSPALDEARAEVERLRAEMLELAEWCEAEEPLSHKKLSYRLRYAQEAKP